MLAFPRYFIAKETKLETSGKETHLFYILEKMEYSGKPGNRRIVETTIANTQYGNFPSSITVEIANDSSFVSKDQAGSFEGNGTLYGQEGCWSVMRFSKGTIAYTKERFEGSYVFLSDRVRAMKTWFDIEKSEPKYFTVQDGKYVSAEDFQRLLQNPNELPAYWNSLAGN